MTHRNLTRGTAQVFSSGAHAFLDRLEAFLDETSMPDWMTRVEELRCAIGKNLHDQLIG